MKNASFTVRAMTRPEVDLAIDWAAAEGWNPGHHDAHCFHAADPDGFWVGLVGDEPVAMISAVKYGDAFGFIGFYIVKPGWRGQGFGMAVWNAGMARLAGRTVGLDGVVDQQANYRKSGFELAWRNCRYQGAGGGPVMADAAIIPLAILPFDAILAFDSLFFPADRRAFLRNWIDQPGAVALGILQDDRLAGYGVLRACRSGYKIGPLFADSPALAERLFLALKARVPHGEPYFLDTPVANPAATGLAERHGMTPVFETARMYTGRAPALPIEWLFGVTSFELG